MQNSVSLTDSWRTVLQNTTLLNSTVVSPIHVDASMTKSSRKRYAINNQYSRSTLDLGKFNDSKLSTFYQSSYQHDQRGSIICLASFDKNRANELSISSQAIRLFKKYDKNAITFISNMGKKGSGKSFWYDKILNLSQVQGAQYSKIRQNPGLYIWSVPFVKNNLRIFMIDWIGYGEGDILSAEDQKLLDLQLLLSQVLVIVPNWEDKKIKIRDVVYANLSSSMSRLTDNGSKTTKDADYWPHSMYCLYRSVRAISTDTDKLTYLFKNYSYSLIQDAQNPNVNQKVSQLSLMESSLLKDQSSSTLLNQKYVKRTSLVFQDIYHKLKGKKYLSIPFTGQTLPFILKHSSKNLSSNKTIKVEKMFNDIKTEIYERKLDSAKFIYNLNYDPLRIIDKSGQNLKKSKKDVRVSARNLENSRMTDSIGHIRTQNQLLIIDDGSSSITQNNYMQSSTKNYLDQSTKINNPQNINELSSQPRSLDQILQVFKRTNQNVLQDFNVSNYDQKMHEKYERKILQYGEMKEKQIILSNKNQTHQILSNTLPYFTHPQQQVQLQPKIVLNYLTQLKTSSPQLNHDRSKPVATRLKDIASYVKQYKFFHVWETQAYYKQRKLQMGLQDKKQELYDLKFNQQKVILTNTHKENIAEQIFDQLNRSTDKIQKTKDQLNLSQKLNKNQITDQDYLKQLQAHKKILDQIFAKNQKILKQFNTDPTASNDPRISLLEQKLDDKKTIQLQVQAGISNLMQSRLNNSASLLSSRRSQIRRINCSQIKKSHINKSMTK